MNTQRMQEISEVLVEARKSATALPGFPGALPESLQEAYAVQRASLAEWPGRVAGWKVGGIPPRHAERLGRRYLAGPVFAEDVVNAVEGEVAPMPVYRGGFAAIEPELIVALGADRSLDRAFAGAEIASSPLPAINDIGPLAVVCDFGNNHGVLLGEEIEDWRSVLAQELRVRCVIDGKEVGARTVPNLALEAGKALDFLIEHAGQQGIDLPEGTLVSTGAITGVHEADVGARSTLDFGRFGSLEMELVPAEPMA